MCRQRCGLSAAALDSAGTAVAATLQSTPFFGAAASVAAYISAQGEVDTSTVIDDAFSSGKVVYLPRVSDPIGFVRWRRDAGLRVVGAWVSEPAEGLPEDLILPSVILLPVVAWAPDGTRLGRGGGFYDRLLAQLRCRGLTLVGLAYGWQRVDRLPREAWDVPLDYVITESEVIAFSSSDHSCTGKEVAS